MDGWDFSFLSNLFKPSTPIDNSFNQLSLDEWINRGGSSSSYDLYKQNTLPTNQPALGGFFRDAQGNLDFKNLNALANLFSSGMNIYGGIKALNIAKANDAFQKKLSTQNYMNNAKNYNAAVDDILSARGAMMHGDINAFNDLKKERFISESL